MKLYEKRIDPAYGVVRLEIDEDGLRLWVAGRLVFSSIKSSDPMIRNSAYVKEAYKDLLGEMEVESWYA